MDKVDRSTNPPKLTLALLLLCWCLTTLATSVTPALDFSQAWVRPAPPSAKVMAAYGELRNRHGQALKIERLSSPQFERVELHEMSMAGDVMKMRRADPYTLAAEETLTLTPGGWHLMLINPREVPTAGDQVEIRIDTDAGAFEFSLRVGKP